MALASTIKEGATTVAATGGSDTTLSSLGVQNGTNTLIFSTDTAVMTQRTAAFYAKLSVANPSALGGFTQSRRKMTLKFPKVKADLTRTMITMEVNVGFDIETTDAEIESYMEQASQMLATTNFLPFWKSGTLA